MESVKNYVFIDPIGKEQSGISTYIKNACDFLKGITNVHIIIKLQQETRTEFQERIYYSIYNKFSCKNTLIEAPEVGASTLLLGYEWKIHIRLHCLLAICEEREGKNITYKSLQEELYVIHKASFISAPSQSIVKETQKFIEINDVFIYPNCLGDYQKKIKKDIDILYLGRFQKIKGVNFIPNIYKKLKKYKFILCGKGAKEFKIINFMGKAISYDGVYDKEKIHLLNRSKTVIIPSLFESFSMVAAEALCSNAFVVTWETNNIFDNFKSDLIKTVPFGHIDKFCLAVETSIARQSAENYKFSVLHEQIQNNYLYGTKKIINSSQKFSIRVMKSYLMNFNTQGEHCMSAIYRKTKKLFRNPKQFFLDSKFHKYLFHKADCKCSTLMNDKVQSINEYVIGQCDLIHDQYIKFEKRDIADKKETCLFFLHKGSEYEKYFFEKIRENPICVSFRKRYLYSYYYTEPQSIYTYCKKDLVNKFDKNNKNILNKFKHLVFFDPLSEFPYASRCASLNSKIIVIVTEDSEAEFLNIDYNYIDVLCIPQKKGNIYIEHCRKLIIYNNEDDLIFKLEVLMKEFSPKAHNMLLPIHNAYKKYENIFYNNHEIVEGIIELDKDIHNDHLFFENFIEYNNFIAQNINSLLLTEECFYAYDTIIKRCKKENDWKKFLGFALSDGRRLVVHE